MKADNLFMGIIYYINYIDYESGNFGESVIYSKPRTYSLYFIKNNLGVDFITKTKYPFDASKLNIGQEYINIRKHKRITLYDYIMMVENLTNKKYELKDNVSRKDVIKLIKVIAEDLRVVENEKQQKVKRFDLK